MTLISHEWVYDLNIGAEVLDQRTSPADVDDLPLGEVDLNDISFNDSLAAYIDCRD
jgi:hypothetical protein